MKKNLLKLILIASTITLLGACNNNNITNSNEQQSTNDTSTSGEQREEFIIDLDRTIFVKGDTLFGCLCLYSCRQ